MKNFSGLGLALTNNNTVFGRILFSEAAARAIGSRTH
jgi:hypothetical protein